MKQNTCKKKRAMGAIHAAARKIFAICGIFAVIGALLIVPAHALVPTSGAVMINFMNVQALNMKTLYREDTWDSTITTISVPTEKNKIQFLNATNVYDETAGAMEPLYTYSNVKVSSVFPHCIDGQTYYLCFNSSGMYPSKVGFFAYNHEGDEQDIGKMGQAIIWNDPQNPYDNINDWYIGIYFEPDVITNTATAALTNPFMSQNKYSGASHLPYYWTSYNETYWQDRYDEGYTAGEADGLNEGYTEGHTAGYQEGYTTGETAGYQEGYTAGETAGYRHGWDDGHDNGYTNGYAAGYEFGTNDTIERMKNILKKATYTAEVSYYTNNQGDFTKQNTTIILNEYKTFIYNGVNFNEYQTQMEQIITSDFMSEGLISGSITLEWAAEDQFDYTQIPIYLSILQTIPANSYHGYIYTANNQRYQAYGIYIDNSDNAYENTKQAKFSISDSENVIYPVIVKKITIAYNFPIQTQNTDIGRFSIITNNAGFQEGYAAGWNDGRIDGTTEAYDNGYAVGESNGYQKGYKAGFESTKNGDWKHLISAVVETPVNTLMSLFNFEILGLDMRIAIASIITISVVIIIIKMVVKFT